MSYLGQNPSLLNEIREEILPAVQGEQINEVYLLEKCPKLSSLINETLRLTVTSSLARVILEPTAVCGKLLRPGSKIMVRSSFFSGPTDSILIPSQLPIRELHYDTDTWGPEPDRLNPNRFLDNSKLSTSLSYRPWGGGNTLCPGRLLARRAANAFVAFLSTKYDVAVDSMTFPKGDGARLSLCVVTVGQDEDMKLPLTPRS